ncbi:hypothetical protein [Massilia rhizosphaerae]|uniref:hypothetical protein n=1 Tax=Massilia rhizosphaerae TaxID=2784389 RepID=UPI0018DDF2C2|nr:hypothetical protein [Massilia rhizosphaerae]
MTRFIQCARAIPSILLALAGTCAALSACGPKPPADVQKIIDDARREAADVTVRLATLPAKCTLGDVPITAGLWLATTKAAPVPGQPYASEFTFGTPIRTRAFRIALNPAALQHLDKVETRDAQGTWSVAWTGVPPDAPDGCEFVKVEHTSAAGASDVAALRITLRPAKEKTMVADAAVLKAD